MTLVADNPGVPAQGLRERAVYAFPDGTQVVAYVGDGQNSVLYYLKDWRLYGADEVIAERNAPAFRLIETDMSGRILIYGYPTRWFIEDLIDTGLTVR